MIEKKEKKRVKRHIDLENISEEELLLCKINELPLKIENTWLQECIEDLYKELDAKGIDFKPECYLADEWLTPEGETCIGIPFYLAHQTLTRLEKKFMIDAEGENKQWCMKLLRHEAGHAISYAYRFHKRKKWQRIFGSPDKEYSDTYKYRPYSKNFVKHLDGYYAQYHPDEDFVETFAIWLTPDIDWNEKYKGWGALQKLKYVDKIMSEVKGKRPPVKRNEKTWKLSTLRITLKNYYKRKRHLLAEDFPDFHDSFLGKVFCEFSKDKKKLLKAADIIKKHRKNILKSATRYSGEKKYIANDILKGMQKRSRELKLLCEAEETLVVIEMSTYITSLLMNYIYTGRYRGEKRQKK